MREEWPPLRYDDWADTCQTVHMWTQVIGKIRMEKTPPINHWWHVPLYVTSRGLGTSPIPDGARTFEIDLDFVDHRLRIATSEGEQREFKLQPMTVADFYGRVMTALGELGIEAKINTLPSEVDNPIRFEEDTKHASYDAAAVTRFWRILLRACQVLTEFRGRFLGKSSPVHFFWGSFDLAVTRFSGRSAPVDPNASQLVREAYSHEVSSAGFWPGGPGGVEPAFYSYAAPEPPGFAEAKVRPDVASYNPQFKQFLLPYEAMRQEPSPSAALLEFAQSTYEAAAELGGWPRKELER